MKRSLSLLIALAAVPFLSGSPALAQPSLVIAGTLHVDLRATNGSAGLATWTNQGSLGNFARNGAPVLTNDVAGSGIPGVLFNGSSDFYLGPVTVPDLEGASDRSVEVWALNPSISDEETLVAWSHRGGPAGSNLSINYGSNVGTTGYGAVGHWDGTYDIGWPTGGVPTANEWHHIVYTYDGDRTASVYVDGALRVSKVLPAPLNTYAGLSLNLGSQRDDATTLTATLRLSGYINTVRVHGGLLSSNDVAANYAYGPAYVPSTEPVAITLPPADQSAPESGYATFTVYASGAKPITYQWYREGAAIPDATNRTLAYGPLGFEDSGAVLFCIASNYLNATAYTATSSVATLTVISAAATLTHRYSFDGNANDSVGTAHGTLQGGAAITNGEVFLNGSSAYVDLPDNLVTGYTSVTFETWVVNSGSGTWARVWDFGNAAGVNMFLTWPSSAPSLRAAYNQGSGEQLVNATVPANNRMVHTVFTQDGVSQVARLYVDGVLAAETTGFTLTPAAIGVTANDWLGRSQYSGDPFFMGRISEFRIYKMAIPASKVLENFTAGPEVPPMDGPVVVLIQPVGTTVIENTPAYFRAVLGGRPPYQAQWYKNNLPIPDATNLTLYSNSVLTDDNSLIQLWATNTVLGTNYTTASSNVVLRVVADTTPPVLVRASGAGPSAFEVLFSEPVLLVTATNLANYALNGPAGPVVITSASLNPDGVSVIVGCAPLVYSQTYTAIVNHVQDLAATPNTIAPNSTASLLATPFRLRDIGGASVPSTVRFVPAGYDLTAGGTGPDLVSDQLTLGFEERTGDFDLAVRLDAVSLSDVWARAGLMARDGLSTNSPFAAVWATPAAAGCFFQARTTTSTNIAPTGAFPVNHPYTWLRLRRTGGIFDGFASIDGQTWSPLGSAVIAMSDTIQVGFAVSPNSTTVTTTAGFRDLGKAGGIIVTNVSLPFEPMAPCSRKTGLVFSEIMYNPPDNWSTSRLEYIELHNPDLIPEDLTGYRIAGDIDYAFPAGTTLPSGGYLVIAHTPSAVESFYGISGVLGPYTNNLPNQTGTVRLINDVGGWSLEVNYGSDGLWPLAADGAGHSLVLRRPSYGENDPRAWGPSDVIGGSPGRGDGWGPESLRSVVINEFLANSDPPLLDFIELYNAANQPVDISGAWLSDTANTNKFRIPDGTVLGPRGFVSFSETTLGFALSSQGEQIYLVNSNRTRIIDALRFGAQAPNVSRGRSPDGSPLWSELAVRTPGTNNSAPLQREIVINEIMYSPLSGLNDDEYIELYNRGGNAVDLSGWRVSGGVSYVFPVGATMPPGGYLVVAENLTNLLAKYPYLTTALTFGNFGGNLKKSGERIALDMPMTTVTTNGHGGVTTNLSYITVNEVTYGTSGRWGRWSAGGGSSLELIDPRADNRFAANWADSDESGKAAWTTIDFTGAMDNGMPSAQGTANRFEIFLQDAGECLVDDLECRVVGGANLITNGGFESNLTGWTFQGTHRLSYLETNAAASGGKSLHVVAVDRGDTGPNKFRCPIPTMAATGNANIRAKVRWLRGTRDILFRVRGNWIEAIGAMNVPTNLGTPGLPNSRLVANAGPAIAETTHVPVAPAAGQPLVVSARVNDPDGLSSVVLRYRLDPAAAYAEVPMRDDGTGGDALAGDGIYSVTVPGQPAGTIIAFYIVAADAAVAPASSLFPNDAPTRECLASFGDAQPSGSMSTYRIWLTQANVNTWTLREKNSNEPFDCTFAYGNSRVIYNVGTLYSGSPWHTPNYVGPLGDFPTDYELNFQGDEQFLGATDFVLNSQTDYETFFAGDASAQNEDTALWFARKLGLGYNHRRPVRLFFNNARRFMLYFDSQQPNNDILAQYYPTDSKGHLHKIEDWFEFDDAGSSFEVITARLLNYTTAGGAKKAARYRWNFRPRAVHGSINDSTNLFTLADAMNNAASPEPYTSAMFAEMDVEEWMRHFALEHSVGNWDSYGYRRGKNCFAYKPDQGPWRLVLWDIDICLGKSSSDGPTANLFDLGTSGAVDQYEPAIAKMYAHPPFVRAFWRALSDLVNGPMLPQNYAPIMQARYNALRANGLPVQSPASVASWIEARRAYILSQWVANASNVFNVSGLSYLQTNTSSITLSGTAPATAKDIVVNGIAYPITWTSVTAWSLRVPLQSGTNVLVIAAVDRNGAIIGSRTVTANYIGADVSPLGLVVLNEIMYDPIIPGTSFLEIFNRSTNVTFDLSDWRIDGVGFIFPRGTVISNRQFLVVARNQFAFANTYGVTNVVAGEFTGNLDNAGETVSLVKPGTTAAQDLVVDRVRYERGMPWPAGAAGQGFSLQLIDAAQDDSRVSNWSGDANGWRFASLSGVIQTNTTNVVIWLGSAGDVYIDDVALVAGSTPGVGQNLIANGGFEAPYGSPWFVLGTGHATSATSTNHAQAGISSLHVVATNAGGVANSLRCTITPPATSSVHTLSFWYYPSTNGTNLTTRSLAGSLLILTTSYRPLPPSSPGTSNNVAGLVQPYPALWLNEVAPQNLSGITDGAGDRDPWIELFNAGSDPISLAGVYLSDNYTNLTQWAFPPSATLDPGQFLVVWADGEPGETIGTEFHTSFRLQATNGVVALSQDAGGTRILDYFNYHDVPANSTYGAVPDGQPFFRQVMFHATPGAANDGSAPASVVYINEWMASNTRTIPNPADGKYDDWFELYNPNPFAVGLSGWVLANSVTNVNQFVVPAGYAIASNGFLLVWADGKPGSNSTNSPVLHVNFKLAAGGEAIALFAPDGRLVDSVTFGQQSSDVSEGRYPDGLGPRYFMTQPTPGSSNVVSSTPAGSELSGISVDLAAGQASFSFSTMTGHSYQVEYTDNVTEATPNWLPVPGGPYDGTGSPILITDNIGAATQRFYRVVLLR
jgi:hypothetical protein